MKKISKNAHTSNSQIGMGDFYGSGIKQKIGRIRDVYPSMDSTVSNGKSKPKKLA